MVPIDKVVHGTQVRLLPAKHDVVARVLQYRGHQEQRAPLASGNKAVQVPPATAAVVSMKGPSAGSRQDRLTITLSQSTAVPETSMAIGERPIRRMSSMVIAQAIPQV